MSGFINNTVGFFNSLGAGLDNVLSNLTVGFRFDKDTETRNQFQSVWNSKWPNMLMYENYDKMLIETRPDIVCIATRQTLHEEQIISAVNLGVRVIACEKPFATSL